MKAALFIIAIAIGYVVCSSALRAQTHTYDVEVYGPANCDSTLSGDQYYVDLPGEPHRPAWYRYELMRDGKVYLRIILLCDGRIVQEVPPHDDIQTDEIAVIGSIPGGIQSNTEHNYTATEFPWGLRIVIDIYQGSRLVATVEYPYPGYETQSISHPALVAYT